MIFVKKIDDLIIESIANNGPLTIQSLQWFLWDKVSQPNLYKKISEYIDKHILIKNWKYIDLNKKRILGLLNFAKDVEWRYINENEISISLRGITHKKYKASSLYELDSIWSSLLAELNLMYNHKEINYIYNSHAYHAIWMPNSDILLFENIWRRAPKTLFLIWNKTSIDEYWAMLLSKVTNTEVLMNNETWLSKNWYFLNVVWDYYLEIILPDALSQYFELIIQGTKNIEDLNIDMFTQLFHFKNSISITIYKNTEQAKKLAKKIELSFKKHKWENL